MIQDATACRLRRMKIRLIRQTVPPNDITFTRLTELLDLVNRVPAPAGS